MVPPKNDTGYLETLAKTLWSNTTMIGTDGIYLSSCNYDPVANKLHEYTEKTDKHVEELEQDIEFLNNERENLISKTTTLEEEVAYLKIRISELAVNNAIYNDKIEKAYEKIEHLQHYIDYIADTVMKPVKENECEQT